MSRIENITITNGRNKSRKDMLEFSVKEFGATKNLIFLIVEYIFNSKYRIDRFERLHEMVNARFVGFIRGILMKRLCIGSLLFVALFVALLLANSSAVEESHPKQILILASYHPGMKWEDSWGAISYTDFPIISSLLKPKYFSKAELQP